MAELTILRGNTRPVDIPRGNDVLTFDEFRQHVRAEGLRAWRHRYTRASLHTYRWEVVNHPFITAALLRHVAREAWIHDEEGVHHRVTRGRLLDEALGAGRDLAAIPSYLHRKRVEARALGRLEPERRRPTEGPAVFLRADPYYGLTAGGSVAHISGVLAGLEDLGLDPRFITTDAIPLVRPSIPVHRVRAPARFANVPSLRGYACDDTLYEEALELTRAERPGFVYARYALGSTAGLKLAHAHHVPLVLEYNGSEVWIHENWGGGLRFARLARDLESLLIDHADLIVVVSKALEEELLRRAIDPERICVAPNGVDLDRYRPEVDGSAVRLTLGLESKTVIGFLGTFGPWHGAPVLARAFRELTRTRPEFSERLHLLWIGDGPERTECESILQEVENTTFVGRVPQAEAPEYLAACDILASPHVPNPDGSEFFGSPTKLYEYLAMGRAIVASDLAQLSEVLHHEHTALLVPPADETALASAIARLADDTALRDHLGRAARGDAIEKHGWDAHVAKIVSRLEAAQR